MRTIHKYPLALQQRMLISMPEGAQVLHGQVNGAGIPCLWALVDTSAPMVSHEMWVFGTGQTLPENLGEFVATFLVRTDGIEYVWHMFHAPALADTP